MNVQTIKSKGSTPVPPEKGAFPLDHFRECTHLFRKYMECLSNNNYANANECRFLSMDYLQCRMDKGLMMKEEMKRLGFADILNEEKVPIEQSECIPCAEARQKPTTTTTTTTTK